MTRLSLLALNEYGSGVIDILIGSVHHIGWCIIGRQAIWREGMLVLDLVASIILIGIGLECRISNNNQFNSVL